MSQLKARLHRQECPPIGTFCFCRTNEETGEAVVFDAPEDSFAWSTKVAEAAGCRVKALVLTHGHWDHMLDAHRFAEAGITVYAHSDDAMLIETPEVMRPFAMPGMPMHGAKVDHWVAHGDTLRLAGVDLEVRHVPGHCPGNILLYCANEGWAVVGDVIFAGGVGRFDLPGGDFDVLKESILNQVYTLPNGTILYPGHGPDTSVGIEMRSNPYVRRE